MLPAQPVLQTDPRISYLNCSSTVNMLPAASMPADLFLWILLFLSNVLHCPIGQICMSVHSRTFRLVAFTLKYLDFLSSVLLCLIGHSGMYSMILRLFACPHFVIMYMYLYISDLSFHVSYDCWGGGFPSR